MTFIQNNLKYYTVVQLCTALKFPRSTYYKALICVPSARQKKYKIFSHEVKRVFDESKGIYGAVKKGTVPDDQENILNRDFQADTINLKWCTDITYIHVLKEGWTYLASVMDLCSRKISGYAYGTSMTAELALEAVKNACLNVKNAEGIILVLAEDYRHTPEYREIFKLRSETTERVFADATEKHFMRYTQLRGLQKVKMQVTLTFAYMNLKS